MKLRYITENYSPFLSAIRRLLPQFIIAAQNIYDSWDQSDEYIGSGGICDEISSAIGDILSSNGIDHTEGGHDGDDHSYLIAYNDQESYIIDIPYDIYERGGGYNWTKIEGVRFTPEDVIIAPVSRPDWI